MRKTSRIVIGFILTFILILVLSTVAFAGNRGSRSGDNHGNKPGKSQYHRCDKDNKATGDQYGCKKDKDDDDDDDDDD